MIVWFVTIFICLHGRLILKTCSTIFFFRGRLGIERQSRSTNPFCCHRRNCPRRLLYYPLPQVPGKEEYRQRYPFYVLYLRQKFNFPIGTRITTPTKTSPFSAPLLNNSSGARSVLCLWNTCKEICILP
ncbi:hypothetical protein CDAR_448761 [Caerostris darwini]|uniref:Secreted protein n=1 Tax=Caerostris darwini TaxID=1538125 RepID=A0AAV4QQZ7_9ARAC|nr:hypothetical protein CDAR_448761 [Caerostris darwini]